MLIGLFVTSASAQVTCTGNVPIENLANGMDYTIVSGASGIVTVTVTVVDNPAGLVGFFGGPGGIFQVADGTGTFVQSFTDQTVGAPFNLDMFFNWADGGQGNSETVTINVNRTCLDIPTAGQWGLLCLTVCFLSTGMIFIREESKSLVTQ